MSVLYIMAPAALVLAGVAIAAFIWAARDGQFDDVDTPQHRALFDDAPIENGDDGEPK
ncbi:MAG: cbb3-type cytochrome oxidase assembly protein CcoS [Planctomycetota bacterium]